MQRSDFHYDLPQELIAQHPAERRSGSRLLDLGLSTDAPLEDRRMLDLPGLLSPQDLLVFNDTRVIPARLLGTKPTGGRVEMLIERILGDREVLAQVGASKTPKAGGEIHIDTGAQPARLVMLGRDDDLFHLRLETPGTMLDLLERVGQLPLPPYISHAPQDEDRERYQTVFASQPGAVAAPTAGLHFDEPLLARLRERGLRIATLTLHVGAGTFQPLRVNDLSQHRMHAERYRIGPELAEDIAQTRRRGGRIVAVGTTVARALESAAIGDGVVRVGEAETRLFITPGYAFRVVDRLLTNFHLPESTLLMLVCAFGGTQRLFAAYRHAVAQRYRFFSYGDAMLISRAG